MYDINLLATASNEQFKVTLKHEGDGIMDVFDPTNCQDIPFLRFSIEKMDGGYFFPIEELSHCTNLACDIGQDKMNKAVVAILSSISSPGGRSIQEVCKHFSFLNRHSFKELDIIRI